MRVVVFLLFFSTIGCGARANAAGESPSSTDWKKARESLRAIRIEEKSDPYSEVVRVRLREPKSGKIFVAQGAIAVDPGKAFRMMLVGPGGGTAVDAWATPNAYVFHVPPIELKKSGGAESPAGLPIGFFRWWFLARWSGQMLWGAVRTDGAEWIVKNDDAVVVLSSAGGTTKAERRSERGVERLEWTSTAARDRAGDHGVYVDDTSGLSVEIDVVSLSEERPDPEAFADPRTVGGVP